LVANGSSVKVFGTAEFYYKTGVKTYKWKFLVASIGENSCIIGKDFIKSQGRTLNFSNMVWKTKAGVVQLFETGSSSIGAIKITEKEKIKKILGWPVSQCCTERKSFLEVVNSYQKYIENCADLAVQLNYLTRKRVKFKWDHSCQETVEALKNALISPSVCDIP
jgi:hypothetical protein